MGVVVLNDPGITGVIVTGLLSSQVLWEKERLQLGLEKKQSFVDLGCGNGLLVYILSSEGVGKRMRSGMEQDDDDADASVFVITLHLIP